MDLSLTARGITPDDAIEATCYIAMHNVATMAELSALPVATLRDLIEDTVVEMDIIASLADAMATGCVVHYVADIFSADDPMCGDSGDGLATNHWGEVTCAACKARRT